MAPETDGAATILQGIDLATLTLEKLDVLPQSSLDELFSALAGVNAGDGAGDMPAGDSRGVAIVGDGAFWRRWIASFAHKYLWQGKVFTRTDADHGVLVNKVSALDVQAIKAQIYRQDSWYDGKPCIVLDYSKTSFLARKVRDEIRQVRPGVYLGLVYWGANKKPLVEFALDFNR
ncbi:MAG TPA: hypothetical protein VG326_11100 [Tepidisphaeraceae bacterium]|jgi:hypothetical protein|nr:hypothetical protein [Tepidisphaeraceae bacterium]